MPALGRQHAPEADGWHASVDLGNAMTKRVFGLTTATLFAILTLAQSAPLVAKAREPSEIPRIGIVWGGTRDDASDNRTAFLGGLNSLGYVEGRTFLLDQRSAMGRTDGLEGLVRELLSSGPTVVVTGGQFAIVAAKRTVPASIAIVFVATASPVERGLVASLARPSGNVTGVAWNAGPEIQAKQLQLQKRRPPLRAWPI